jgi:hypothetical protein
MCLQAGGVCNNHNTDNEKNNTNKEEERNIVSEQSQSGADDYHALSPAAPL